MTIVKPPNSPGASELPAIPESTKRPTGPDGVSFQTHVTESRSLSERGATQTSEAVSVQSVIADLQTGKIAPHDALHKLTDLAVQQSGASVAMRPAIEARLREFLARDPLIQDFIRQMGAAVTSDR